VQVNVGKSMLWWAKFALSLALVGLYDARVMELHNRIKG
jgi:hypothetical protein